MIEIGKVFSLESLNEHCPCGEFNGVKDYSSEDYVALKKGEIMQASFCKCGNVLIGIRAKYS